MSRVARNLALAGLLPRSGLRGVESVVLTRQGVRDLGGNSRVRQRPPQPGCRHLWEGWTDWDCWEERPVRRKRCGFCQEIA